MSQIKWINKNAIKHLLLSIKNYGSPSVMDKNENGIAIWNNNDLKNKTIYDKPNCFQEMIIRDESIEHLCPSLHYDFMYNSIVVPVKPEQIKILLSLSGSVIYDPLKNFLTVRCGSIEANIATLALCTDLLLGNHSINDVHSKGIYGKMINKTSDENFVKGLYANLCNNIKELKQSKTLNKGFWPAAFSVINNSCLPPDKADKLYGGADKADKLHGGANKPQKVDKSNKAKKVSKPNKPKKVSKPNKPEKTSKSNKLHGGTNKPNKPEKVSKANKPEKVDKSNKPKKMSKSNKPSKK